MSYGETYEKKFEKELAVIRYAEKMGDREAASRVARREEQIAAESAEDLRHANSEQKGMEMRDMSNTHELGGSRRTRRRRKRKPSRRRTAARKRSKRSRAKRSTKRRRTRGRK
jgi:hypothetical protein